MREVVRIMQQCVDRLLGDGQARDRSPSIDGKVVPPKRRRDEALDGSV